MLDLVEEGLTNALPLAALRSVRGSCEGNKPEVMNVRQHPELKE